MVHTWDVRGGRTPHKSSHAPATPLTSPKSASAFTFCNQVHPQDYRAHAPSLCVHLLQPGTGMEHVNVANMSAGWGEEP